MFKPEEFVIVKPGTKNAAGEVIDNWGGEVFSVREKERMVLVALDAISMASISDDFLLYCINEGYTSVEHPFSFDELEISVARNTDEEVMAAIDTLIDRELDLEGHVPDFMAITNVWVDEFTESSKFNALEESLKKDVAMAARSFVEHIYNHEFAIPEEWTPTNVKSVCLEIIPSSVTAEIEFFERFGKALIEFLKFLGEKEYIHNSVELMVTAEQIKKQIPIEARNPENWGNTKRMMMAVKESGIDLSDREAIDRYLSTMSPSSQLPSVTSTSAPRPLSNPFKGMGRNEKVVVQYPDGRVVENIKFKKVEKELKEGKCELIG